jgi:hypothetical protein
MEGCSATREKKFESRFKLAPQSVALPVKFWRRRIGRARLRRAADLCPLFAVAGQTVAQSLPVGLSR